MFSVGAGVYVIRENSVRMILGWWKRQMAEKERDGILLTGG
jgi:hypothetical protein